MTPALLTCGWFLVGADAATDFPANAPLVLVRDRSVAAATEAPAVLLQGEPVAFAQPLAPVVLVAPNPGVNRLVVDRCTWDVVVTGAADTSAPSWAAPPTARLFQGMFGPIASSWTLRTGEPGMLLVWRAGDHHLRALIPTSGDLELGFVPREWAGHIVDPTTLGTLSPVVVRPMDLGGNLGAAWLLNPQDGSTSPVYDVSAYTWDPAAPDR